MSGPDLKLHEEVLLLALHDRKGTVTEGMYLYAMGGGILAELALAGRIGIREEAGKKQKKRVEVLDPTPVGDEILDEALERIATAKRAASPERWVPYLGGTRRLKERVATALARRGVLRRKEEEILLFFRRKVWPTLDAGPEREVTERVRRTILHGEDPEVRTATLVGLLKGTNMLGTVLDGRETKASKERIEAIVAGGCAGAATSAAAEAAEAATVAVAVAAATAATTAAMIAATS